MEKKKMEKMEKMDEDENDEDETVMVDEVTTDEDIEMEAVDTGAESVDTGFVIGMAVFSIWFALG